MPVYRESVVIDMSLSPDEIYKLKQNCRSHAFGVVGQDHDTATALIITINHMVIPTYDRYDPGRNIAVYIVELNVREDGHG